jgi:WG containing repeat
MKTTTLSIFFIFCAALLFAQAPQKPTAIAGYDSTAILKDDANPLSEKGRYKYDKIYSICDDLYVEKNKKKGVFTNKGEVLVAVEYDTVRRINDTHFLINKDKLWGFINTKTGFVQPPIFDKIKVSPTALWYKKGAEYGFIKNDTMSKFRYKKLETREYIRPCGDGIGKNCERSKDFEQCIFIAQKNKKKGFIDENDKIILPFQYDSIVYLRGSFRPNKEAYLLKKAKNWRFMTCDKTTKKINFPIPIKYKKIIYIAAFPDNNRGNKAAFIVQNKRNKYGIVSADNEVLLPIIHDSIQHPTIQPDYPIAVCDNLKKWSVFALDRTHQTPYEYDAVKLLYDLNIVTQNGKKGLLNEKTVLILPCEYDDIQYIKGNIPHIKGNFKLIKDGKTGWADNYGRIIEPLK